MQPQATQGAHRFDLFISYASADNRSDGKPGPWVDQFVTRLSSTLEMRMGSAPRIWFEQTTSDSSRISEQALAALSASALFIPILSPAYTASPRCMREIRVFSSEAGKERILKVVRQPDDSPLPLPAYAGYDFYRMAGPHSVELVDQPYWAVLNRLASQIKFLLTGIGKANPAAASHQPQMEVFLCHSSGDKASVRKLWERLQADGFAPWLDEKELLPGQRWETEIRNAIDRAGAIIVCLSTGSINKEGFLQREIRLVLDRAAEIPEESIFLIPARLEDCPVPRRLGELQWVNLFEDSGYPRLLQALRMRAGSVSARQ